MEESERAREMRRYEQWLGLESRQRENDVPGSSKVLRIVEHLRDRLEHDCLELLDVPVESILASYGVFEALSRSERQAILEELFAIAEQREFSEMAYLVHRRVDSVNSGKALTESGA